MKVLTTARPDPVPLPHPLFFEHTTQDSRRLLLRCPRPYRLKALADYWGAHDFSKKGDCPTCDKAAPAATCSICTGTGQVERLSDAEVLENTEAVACAMLGSFWADTRYILESVYQGDMDVFSTSVAYEVMSGEHALKGSDVLEIFTKCSALFMKHFYTPSKAAPEVKEAADFLSHPPGGTLSLPTTLESTTSETSSDSSTLISSDNTPISPTIELRPKEAQ